MDFLSTTESETIKGLPRVRNSSSGRGKDGGGKKMPTRDLEGLKVLAVSDEKKKSG